MKEGQGFGELALQKERLMPRAATIKSNGACKLAVMSKANYKNVIEKIDGRKLKKLIEFFKSIPFLRNSTKTYLTKLHYNWEPRQYRRN